MPADILRLSNGAAFPSHQIPNTLPRFRLTYHYAADRAFFTIFMTHPSYSGHFCVAKTNNKQTNKQTDRLKVQCENVATSEANYALLVKVAPCLYDFRSNLMLDLRPRFNKVTR